MVPAGSVHRSHAPLDFRVGSIEPAELEREDGRDFKDDDYADQDGASKVVRIPSTEQDGPNSESESREVKRKLAKHRRELDRNDPLAVLTAREHEVLTLVAEGRSNAAVADRLVLAERTIETHMRSIFQKLRIEETGDSHRRVLAVLAYVTHATSPLHEGLH